MSELQSGEQTLFDSRPAMLRSRPVLFLVYVVLIAAFGLGLILLIIWWVQTLGTRLTVTDRRVILRHGILSKSTTELWLKDVRNVQVHQGALQRIMGVGTLGISSAGQAGVEIGVSGMPSPGKVRELINSGRSSQ